MISKLKKKFNKKFKDEDFSEILKKGSGAFGISIVGRFIGYLLLMVIGWIYGQEAMGVYTVGLSILSIVGLFESCFCSHRLTYFTLIVSVLRS